MGEEYEYPYRVMESINDEICHAMDEMDAIESGDVKKMMESSSEWHRLSGFIWGLNRALFFLDYEIKKEREVVE